jgi:PIN domain nuclease of toxin-antitoxin system
MKLLADSHVLVWWLDDPDRLSVGARNAIADPRNDVLVSAASIWELGLKIARGKLQMPEHFLTALREDGFSDLAVTNDHAHISLHLPPIHGDPFDRMLIAQTLEEGLVLVTRDQQIHRYEVPLLRA